MQTKKVVAGLAHRKKIEIEKKTNILTSEVYLELSRTSMTDRHVLQRLKVVNYFRSKAPSQIFGWAINTPLNFKMVAGLAHKKCLKKQQIKTN